MGVSMCGNGETSVSGDNQPPEGKVWKIRSKLLGGTFYKTEDNEPAKEGFLCRAFKRFTAESVNTRKTIFSAFGYFVFSVIIIVILTVLAVFANLKDNAFLKFISTFSFAAFTVINAYIEWRGDVIKEAIDRVDDYPKYTNRKGLIARHRELALLAKAVKFVAAFATVLVGTLD